MRKLISFFLNLFHWPHKKVAVNLPRRKSRIISVRVFNVPARRRPIRKAQTGKKTVNLQPFMLPILLAIFSCLDTVLFFNGHIDWATGGLIGAVVGLVTYILIRYWKNNWQNILRWCLAVLVGMSTTLFWTNNPMQLLNFPWAVAAAIGSFLTAGFIKPVVNFIKKLLMGMAKSATKWLKDISLDFSWLKKINWKKIGQIAFCLMTGIVSSLYWLDNGLPWWQISLGGLQTIIVSLLLYFRRAIYDWLATDRHWLIVFLISLTLTLTITGYLVWQWAIFYAILFGAGLVILSLTTYANRAKIINYVKEHGKKIAGWVVIALIILSNIILFGPYIWKFVFNNIAWGVGALGLIVALTLIVTNWGKIKGWQIWEKENLLFSHLNKIAIFCGFMAIVAIVFFKSVQFMWLFILLYLALNRLDKIFSKLATETIEPDGKIMEAEVKFPVLIKASFGLNEFWTWGFIFLSGMWTIVYIM